MHKTEQIGRIITSIRERIGDFEPEIALILGSGLGTIADSISDAVVVKYETIPDFPRSTVKGHAGELVFGTMNGKKVVAMKGRIHFYEGHGMEKTTLPTRILYELGARILFLTTATGAINKELTPGDLMVIDDQINLSLTNPLIGPNDNNVGPRFLDTSECFDSKLISTTHKVAKELDIDLKQGTYLFTTGPTYETPAEVRMMRFLGADVTGMSCVPESIIAAHCGMRTLGITFVANMGAGIIEEVLTHDDVMDTMNLIKEDFVALIQGVVTEL